jgi:hypothetical protein
MSGLESFHCWERATDESPTGAHDGSAIVTAEIGDGLMVRSETPDQPHDLDIAFAFAFQPSRRSDLVEVAVNVELQKIARIVSRPTGGCGRRPIESQCPKVRRTSRPTYSSMAGGSKHG